VKDEFMQTTHFEAKAIKPLECLKEAWALIKPNYWLLFAVTIVGAVISGMTLYLLIGAMMCGIMRCYLRQIDGRTFKFEDLWEGMSLFRASLPTAIIVVVPIVAWMIIMMVTIYLPIVMAAVMGDHLSGGELLTTFGGLIVFDVIFAVIMTCIHSLLVFALPLVADRGLSGFQPVALSARAVMKNLGGIGGLIGINFLMGLVGSLTCGLGLYLLIPLMLATTMVAYRKVFPAMPSSNLNLRPPNAYSGLQ
jgi:uncharacterized membrane protein